MSRRYLRTFTSNGLNGILKYHNLAMWNFGKKKPISLPVKSPEGIQYLQTWSATSIYWCMSLTSDQRIFQESLQDTHITSITGGIPHSTSYSRHMMNSQIWSQCNQMKRHTKLQQHRSYWMTIFIRVLKMIRRCSPKRSQRCI